MRNAFADALFEAAAEDERIAVVAADISPAGRMAEFAAAHPDRFVNVGVAEQAMVGIAAGLALRGRRVFCYSIAPFSLYRPFEFVRDDVALQNLSVTIVGMGAGLVYSTLGATHNAVEDVAIASTLPNVTVLAPCDPAETREVTRWIARTPRGPVYLRLGKSGEPDLTSDASEPWRPGRFRLLRGGEDRIAPAIVGYGPILAIAIEAGRRIGSPVYGVTTVNPLPFDDAVGLLAAHERIVVVEEAIAHGGLSSALRSLANEARSRAEIVSVALPVPIVKCYGSYADVLAANEMTVEHVLRAVQ